MNSSIILTNDAFNLEAIKLGSLIPSIKSPHQDGFAPLDLVEGRDYLVRVQQDFQALMSNSSTPKFHARLTKLLSASYHEHGGRSIQLSAQEGRIYELVQPKALFRKMCALPATKEWLQAGIEDQQKTYFITGFRSFCDAVRKEYNSSTTQLSGNLEVPLGSIISPGVELIVGDMLNVGVGGGYGSAEKTQISHRNPKEQIYAICYRRVVFKWFQRRDVDKAFLEQENRWKVVADNRSDGDEDSGEELVEADLGDLESEEEGEVVLESGYGDEKYVILQ